jgi:cellulose synthase/poly-beta-1,6-N-acetylglucosamine synthase-like glycosyltransferase
MGKNHALHVGVQKATGNVLMFTDADCRLTSPRTVSVAAQRMVDQQAGLLCILPNLERRTFWEHAVQLVAAGVMMIWFEPSKVNNPRRRRFYANGAFILIRREVYDRIGGHEAVRGVMQEDMELGRLVKAGGHGLHVTRSRELFRVRMYKTFPAMLKGWTRIFYGSFPKIGQLVASLVLICVMSLLPWIIGGVALGVALSGAAPPDLWWTCVWVSLATIILQQTAIARFYRVVEASGWLFCTYLPGNVIVIATLIAALAKHLPGSTMTWKGTTYDRPNGATDR